MKLSEMFFRLNQGEILKVILKENQFGCLDAQDICHKQGYVELYKKGEYFRIDNQEGENILCVDDKEYIGSIIDKVIGGKIIE